LPRFLAQARIAEGFDLEHHVQVGRVGHRIEQAHRRVAARHEAA
jgi:hypothetical protein